MTDMNWTLQPLTHASTDWRADWDRLAETEYAGLPIVAADFCAALLQHFAPRAALLARLVESGQTQGLAILEVAGAGLRLYRPEQAPMPMLVLRHGDGQAAQRLRALAHALPWRRPLLNLLSQDPAFGGLTEADLARIGGRALPYGTTIHADLGAGFEAYWAARSKKLRDNIKRYRKRAEAEGHRIELRCHDAPQHMTADVADYGLIESSGWKGREGTALHPDNVQGRFYADVMLRYAQRGRARTYSLWFGDRKVAARLALAGPQSLVFLKTTYDEAYANFAAGRLLLHAVLEHVAGERSIARVEFYTKANQDMLEWASGQRDIIDVELYRAEWVGRLLGMLRRLRRV